MVRPIASTMTLYCYRVCIQGDNLDSVETSEIRVTVGGEECNKTTSKSRRSDDIVCTAPLELPGGENPAMIQVSDYNYITVQLNCVTVLFR